MEILYILLARENHKNQAELGIKSLALSDLKSSPFRQQI